MQKPLLLIALTSILAVFSGCKKTVTYVTLSGDSFASAEPGQTLVWDLVPPYGRAKSFMVSFINGPDPCGTHPDLVGSPGHPATCKVTAQPPGAQKYVLYQYKIKLSTDAPAVHLASASETPWQVIPCNNCLGIVGSPGSNNSQVAPIVQTAQVVVPHPLAATFSGTVNLSCDALGKVVADPPNPSVLQESVVEWYIDPSLKWQITFDTPADPYPTICDTGNSLSSTPIDSSFCSVRKYQTANPIPYSYGVKITSSDGTPKCSTPAPTQIAPSPFALTMQPTGTQ